MMKIARPSADDMTQMFSFFNDLEEVLRDTRYGFTVEDEDVGAIVKKHWGKLGPGVGACWSRVMYGMDTLLRNCTDPEADTLEWRSDISEWLDSQETSKGE